MKAGLLIHTFNYLYTNILMDLDQMILMATPNINFLIIKQPFSQCDIMLRSIIHLQDPLVALMMSWDIATTNSQFQFLSSSWHCLHPFILQQSNRTWSGNIFCWLEKAFKFWSFLLFTVNVLYKVISLRQIQPEDMSSNMKFCVCLQF